jgi:phosphatidyl-myo-inositol dimannoside synthase
MTSAGPQGINIVALLSEAYGGNGEISKYNRDLLMAFNAAPRVTRTVALPRTITSPIPETIPETVVFDRLAAGGKTAFALRWFKLLTRSNVHVHLVICCHIHLLPLAWVLARFTDSRLALIIHDIEAWHPTGMIFADRLVNSVDDVISANVVTAERFAAWSRIPLNKCFILPDLADSGFSSEAFARQVEQWLDHDVERDVPKEETVGVSTST